MSVVAEMSIQVDKKANIFCGNCCHDLIKHIPTGV